MNRNANLILATLLLILFFVEKVTSQTPRENESNLTQGLNRTKKTVRRYVYKNGTTIDVPIQTSEQKNVTQTNKPPNNKANDEVKEDISFTEENDIQSKVNNEIENDANIQNENINDYETLSEDPIIDDEVNKVINSSEEFSEDIENHFIEDNSEYIDTNNNEDTKELSQSDEPILADFEEDNI